MQPFHLWNIHDFFTLNFKVELLSLVHPFWYLVREQI
jgi:hypothetical protein